MSNLGIMKSIKNNWKAATTAEKIGYLLDIVCGIGSGAASWTIGRKLSEGENLFGRICIKTTCVGLGLAGGEVAAKALQTGYGEPLAQIIDITRKKLAEKKEEEEDGLHE